MSGTQTVHFVRRLARSLVFPIILGLGLSLAWTAPARSNDIPVDLELILAVDVSGSIDQGEAILQREGYLAALSSPDVLAAITSGEHGRVAMAYVEWAGLGYNRLVVDWMLIDDADSAIAFAQEIGVAAFVTGRRTSISGAIGFALPMFENNGYAGTRQIIDISGDGPNNNGTPVLAARDQAIAQGVGINGLAILNTEPGPLGFPILPDLDIYYEECVIAGPGAFVLVADGHRDFAGAIRRKLVLEIAGVIPTEREIRRASAYDCFVGERQLQDWLRNNPFEP